MNRHLIIVAKLVLMLSNLENDRRRVDRVWTWVATLPAIYTEERTLTLIVETPGNEAHWNLNVLLASGATRRNC